ncbi:MAG TPA: hypothetical protein EYO88_03925 [Alphaproteobacteria bacterium]|nr:hypothetical protein [Alphaproteobacteria bacterium]
MFNQRKSKVDMVDIKTADGQIRFYFRIFGFSIAGLFGPHRLVDSCVAFCPNVDGAEGTTL